MTNYYVKYTGRNARGGTTNTGVVVAGTSFDNAADKARARANQHYTDVNIVSVSISTDQG